MPHNRLRIGGKRCVNKYGRESYKLRPESFIPVLMFKTRKGARFTRRSISDELFQHFLGKNIDKHCLQGGEHLNLCVAWQQANNSIDWKKSEGVMR